MLRRQVGDSAGALERRQRPIRPARRLSAATARRRGGAAAAAQRRPRSSSMTRMMLERNDRACDVPQISASRAVQRRLKASTGTRAAREMTFRGETRLTRLGRQSEILYYNARLNIAPLPSILHAALTSFLQHAIFEICMSARSCYHSAASTAPD